MKRILPIFILLITVISCNKESNSEEFNGVIEDYRGRLDGCAYLIQLDNGTRLEPAVNSSGETLIPGKRIAIKYKNKPAFSICMAGQTVEIISLRYL